MKQLKITNMSNDHIAVLKIQTENKIQGMLYSITCLTIFLKWCI